MKIKILWGFIAEPGKVPETEGGRVRAGLVTTVDDSYAHDLIGRGLAKAYGDKEAAAEQDVRDARGKRAQAESDLAAREKALSDGHAELQTRQDALDDREKELASREEDVARREEALRAAAEASDKPADGNDGDGSGKPATAPKKTKPATPAETK